MQRRSATRTVLAALVVAAFAASAAAPAQSGTRERPTCKRPHTRTVAHDRVARVFEKRLHDGLFKSRLYGCLKSVGKAMPLAEAYDDEYVTSSAYSAVRLAGRFVAWRSSDYDISCKADCPPGYDPQADYVSVRDLRRRRSHVIDIDSEAKALVVTRFGAIAWAQGSGDHVSLFAYDGLGRREIAEGVIDTTSIAVAGGTLSWTQDGQQRSAELQRF